MFKVLVKNSNGQVEMSNKFETRKEAVIWMSNEDVRLGDQYTFELSEETTNELQTIKKHWEVGNLTSGEIAWLLEQADKVTHYEELLRTAQNAIIEQQKLIKY